MDISCALPHVRVRLTPWQPPVYAGYTRVGSALLRRSPSPYRLGSHRERTHLRISVHHVRGLLSRLSEWIVSYSDSQVRIIIFHFPPSLAVCAVTILSACTGYKQRWAHNCQGPTRAGEWAPSRGRLVSTA